MTDNRKADMLRKIRALMAKAEGTDHPEEADAFRQKADELMTAYAIMEWELEQARPGESNQPERRFYDFSWWDDRTMAESVRTQLWYMLLSVSSFARCRAIGMRLTRNRDGAREYGGLEIPVLGLPSDLDYMDMLFTSLMVDMLGHLEPRPKPDLPMIENLVRMKEAGMKWERIGKLLYDVGQLDKPYTRNTGVKFTKLYTDYCTEHNRDRVYTSPSVWQRSYAEAYSLEVGRRLSEMERQRRTVTSDNTEADKYALVVKSTESKTMDLWKELYPDMFQQSAGARRGRRRSVVKADTYKRSAEAMAAGQKAGQAARIVQPGEKLTSNRRSIDA
jgi:phage gp46-like protein